MLQQLGFKLIAFNWRVKNVPLFETEIETLKTHGIHVGGTVAEPMHRYPSQGDRELEMMHTIEQSGWRGPVGLNTETGGDAEVTLRNCLLGLDWLATELKRPGSAGPRPFPRVR